MAVYSPCACVRVLRMWDVCLLRIPLLLSIAYRFSFISSEFSSVFSPTRELCEADSLSIFSSLSHLLSFEGQMTNDGFFRWAKNLVEIAVFLLSLHLWICDRTTNYIYYSLHHHHHLHRVCVCMYRIWSARLVWLALSLSTPFVCHRNCLCDSQQKQKQQKRCNESMSYIALCDQQIHWTAFVCASTLPMHDCDFNRTHSHVDARAFVVPVCMQSAV